MCICICVFGCMFYVWGPLVWVLLSAWLFFRFSDGREVSVRTVSAAVCRASWMQALLWEVCCFHGVSSFFFRFLLVLEFWSRVLLLALTTGLSRFFARSRSRLAGPVCVVFS
uniref:Transmembrane protein n=1 Tax=Toxoplasma gondii (strain ATCC 50861 / VEG) TaxID=432359 RepID=A0A0F7V407_TOXGV|nr:TPA: hypothetical protein BN1205_023610 [Toxoplasma gondii VEG]